MLAGPVTVKLLDGDVVVGQEAVEVAAGARRELRFTLD